MIKTCALCGKDFEFSGSGIHLVKYCTECRPAANRARALHYFYNSEKHLRVEHVRRCKVCGKLFEAKTNAKYCPDCRTDAYRKQNLDYVHRIREIQRDGRPAVKRVAKPKPKADPKKNRLAYLRRRLEQATTPEIRTRYFRQYVLLKQELLRGDKHD